MIPELPLTRAYCKIRSRGVRNAKRKGRGKPNVKSGDKKVYQFYNMGNEKKVK
jgi:hypothetical protein